MTKLTVAFRHFANAPKQRDGIFPNVERAGQIKLSLQANSFRLVRFHATRIIFGTYLLHSRSQWPRGLSRRSAAARLLILWVRIPTGAWMSVVSVVCFQVQVSATS